ncbi:MAG: undecaprenyldiphospho-muramoylpentapeptide beta-N-acetylglucosaminyltransferase [Clostridiales bacterium]|nr:undecaprenyldiphospho-muramoylpentapeptide beta-N-acetylglucosaminyltransferase [Clostridiales bacterium]
MKYLFATGGTGGHINPALAVAGYIREKQPDAEILFIGTKEKMEARLVPQAGFDFKTITISGFQRKLSVQNIKRNIETVFKIFKASSQAKKILLEFKPDVVIGFGGYVSGPVLREAVKLGFKTAIHEQNAFPGKTNKVLAKDVDAVMLTTKAAEKYFNSKNPCILTGLPVRSEIINSDKDIARAELKVDDRPLILSMGGSLGAKAINEAVVELISKTHSSGEYQYIHAMGQYGLWVPEKLKEKGVDIEKEKNIRIVEYINNMDKCLPAADLVICRAGASSISEIQASGKAAILIPSPNVAENHQYHNAMALVNENAALLIEEKDLTGEKLTQTVNEILSDKEKLKALGDNAKKTSIIDSNERIYNVIMGLLN